MFTHVTYGKNQDDASDDRRDQQHDSCKVVHVEIPHRRFSRGRQKPFSHGESNLYYREDDDQYASDFDRHGKDDQQYCQFQPETDP
ncbi:hypothetical protein SDC9_188002 [bioreactor metagenome]|uniref:Uncharacterized protein n=1 Tax=bioreactor metagenome TaxID=1076179 RepID=A0A645HN37_9ZZZZ